MDIKELVEKCDIVEYIRQFSELEEKDGEWWCKSFFNEENTPSFSVNRNGLWYDFSAGKGGNILTFIMEYKKMNIRQAISELKGYLNVTDDVTFEQLEIVRQMKKFRVKEKAEKVVHRMELPCYYINRYKKVTIQQWIDEGISQEIMDLYGVRWDVNNQAAVFEVRDNDGKLISFKERRMGDDFKKLELPKYRYTHQIGTNDFLWGLYKNKEECISKNEIILVEGEKSVMKLETWGIKNCAAITTSHLNENQFKTLIQLGVNVVVALDKNVDVYKDEVWKKLKLFCKVYVIKDYEDLIGEKDAPVDSGKNVWEHLYERKKLM